MRKNITIVIPSYNGKKLLEKNLPAVISEMLKGDELIIIEDAGTDNTTSWLEKEIKKKIVKKGASLKVIVNKKNLRFGASCNKAVKVAKHDLIFLLNNDVSPQPGCVKALLSNFAQNDVFAVGCLEKEVKNGKEEYHGKNKLWFDMGLFMHSKADDFESGETAWVIGGSGMFDKKKWLELGGFDELFYPAYWEDIDLSFRARKKGWKVLFEEQAKVDHNHESTNLDVFGQKKLENISWANGLKFTWKNGDIWQKIAFVIWQPYWIYKRFLG
ncbi:MAG: glycosyltransferase [Candidatus Pacebacteria bacterium]|nr:glycosyltransferase [Candidatus Paceibacterota bacterium]